MKEEEEVKEEEDDEEENDEDEFDQCNSCECEFDQRKMLNYSDVAKIWSL